MPTRTPPLPALRSFAALVRLGSISAAAQELSLTQGAISHQIRSLETFLDTALVERTGRKLTLTEEGRVYGYQVRQALEDVAAATDRLRLRARPTGALQALRIAVLPSFASGWLLPRLSAFTARHPHLRLTLKASMALVDFEDESVDCALRFGHGQWPEVQVRPLMRDRLLLVASPEFCHRHMPQSVAAALKLPLLHASESWSVWLASAGAGDSSGQRPPAFMEFTDSTHMLDAARRGFGIALTRRSIADDLLARGELVPVTEQSCQHPSAYYALWRRGQAPVEALGQFLDWLQATCRRFEEYACIQAPPTKRVTPPG